MAEIVSINDELTLRQRQTFALLAAMGELDRAHENVRVIVSSMAKAEGIDPATTTVEELQ